MLISVGNDEIGRRTVHGYIIDTELNILNYSWSYKYSICCGPSSFLPVCIDWSEENASVVLISVNTEQNNPFGTQNILLNARTRHHRY